MGEPTFTGRACFQRDARRFAFSLLVEYLCRRLHLLNPVPVSWVGGVGRRKVLVGLGRCWRIQHADRGKGVWLGRQIATAAICQNHEGSILRNSQALPS